MMNVRVGGPTVRIRLNGHHHDVDACELHLSRFACDAAVRSAVAEYLDIAQRTLSDAEVQKDPSGHFTVLMGGPKPRLAF